MNKKLSTARLFLLGSLPTLVLGLAWPAHANWERVPLQSCSIPRAHEGVISDITGSMFSGHDAYCAVPDNTSIPVATIKSYQLWGITNPTGGQFATGTVRVLACNAFADSQGFECAAAQNLPAGRFTAFKVNVPSIWSQWWNTQYVFIDAASNSNFYLGRILVQN